MQPIAEGLFTQEAQPRLIGGRSRTSGRIVFPCPADADHEPYPLSRRGKLWSYTIQRYRPKTPPYAGPEAFEPWAVAYVELPGEAIVESRLTDVAFDDIEIGMELELTQFAFARSGGGGPVLIHAFRPVEAAQ
ncbi:DNA-binding protein [Sphingomonas sp. Root710]|uniref:Zn-ribbon domain-containing OB-fold protein n=1 Tax=Sphingomonas sp. Root710 TaxID=1736594 RepID=UPI0006FF7587|nr:OB-fold domain-containing protein [Sphingomonas sp. Root710]KRB85268.1 DNA-binding protein [Sphingomonas sp. Root710]